MRAFMMPGRKRSALLPVAPILAALIMQAHHTKRHTMRLFAKTIRKASFFAIVAKKSSFVLIFPAVLSSFASLRIARAFVRARGFPPLSPRAPLSPSFPAFSVRYSYARGQGGTTSSAYLARKPACVCGRFWCCPRNAELPARHWRARGVLRCPRVLLAFIASRRRLPLGTEGARALPPPFARTLRALGLAWGPPFVFACAPALRARLGTKPKRRDSRFPLCSRRGAPPPALRGCRPFVFRAGVARHTMRVLRDAWERLFAFELGARACAPFRHAGRVVLRRQREIQKIVELADTFLYLREKKSHISRA